MAEARSEEEEENMMRDNREQVVRRQPNNSGGRPDRRKPEHRHSQGPLSSIRAAIKRTSNRSTSLSESSRERDRDRDRERRRPEITILSAEPLASTSWFPGASAGFPPPPPPAAQIWGPTIPPAVQPPPSYEEVIREKKQEQVLLPSSSSSSSSSSRSSTTIATQTDSGSVPDHPDLQARRPVRPPRPRLPYASKSIDETSSTSSQSTCASLERSNPTPDLISDTSTQCCDLLELCSPLTSNSKAQTDQWDHAFAALDVAIPPASSSERPRPRPRTRLSAPPISNEVKVQTLVKLREDGLATLAARSGAKQEASQGRYLQELLEAFSADDWGFPERRGSSSGNSQSESEEEDEEEEDMATLKARIQAFEQQQVAEASCGDTNNKDFVITKKPEPRPRPRLQPTKSAPPTVAPKPKNFSQAPKPSTKGFWEDPVSDSCSSESLKTSETLSKDLEPKPDSEPAPSPVPQAPKSPEKPLITPKPQSVPETPQTATPIPAPRPPPPKLTPSDQQTKPPPRPPVAPRASLGAPVQEKSTTAGHTTPSLPPRPSSGGVTETGSEETQEVTNQTGKVGSSRPGIPTKPAALTSLRRSSAPNLAPKPTTGVSPTLPDPNPAPPKPTAAPTIAPKPQGPTPSTKPQTTAPAPALRKGSLTQTKPDTPSTVNSSDPPLPPRPSGVKLLPLRPPPIKSIPGRPPPPSISSSSSTAQLAPPTSKASPAPCVSSSTQSSSSSQPDSSVSANQIQKVPKKGPPLPPRPKPGHPLYNSYMKQEVLIVLDDPTPSEPPPGEGRSQTDVINQSQCLLDLDDQPKLPSDQDSQSKPALEELSLSDSQSIIPVQPSEQKEQPDPPPVSGPRCVALFDYEGEEEDELTFSQGDVIALLELIGQDWGRGQIHGRVGIFPLSFTEVIEPPQKEETTKRTTDTPDKKTTSEPESSEKSDSEVKEWAVALFNFPGQTAEDLSFHKGALIQVLEHVDAEWRRGRVEGREGLYPAAFTQAQPITSQHSAQRGVAKFDFTAESEDELTLKVGDIITQVESVDEQWILGVSGGKRGIVPKNYISLL